MTIELTEPRFVVYRKFSPPLRTLWHRRGSTDSRRRAPSHNGCSWPASASKNPALPDTYYLGRLAAPGTVGTSPEQTLLAYADHGVTCDLMKPDHAEARRCIEQLRAAGMDVGHLADRLQSDGASALATAWADLLDSIRVRTT